MAENPLGSNGSEISVSMQLVGVAMTMVVNLRCRMVLLLCLLACVHARAENEVQVRNQLSEKVTIAFATEDFQALESMATEFLREKSRTPSGLWKLTVFNLGLATTYRSFAGNEAGWQAIEARFSAWKKRHPASAAAVIGHANAQIRRGWAYRGTKFAAEVQKDAWPQFHEHVAKARQLLEQSKAFAHHDPRWYESMIHVAIAQGWDDAEFNSLVAEALEKEPTFYPTYFSASVRMLPKWGGNLQKVKTFVDESVRATRKSEGDGMYARIYWNLSQAECDCNVFEELGASWPRMKSGFDDVLARYPDAWNLNNYARFSCQARDRNTTAALFKRIGNDIVPAAWPRRGLLEQCRNEAAR